MELPLRPRPQVVALLPAEELLPCLRPPPPPPGAASPLLGAGAGMSAGTSVGGGAPQGGPADGGRSSVQLAPADPSALAALVARMAAEAGAYSHSGPPDGVGVGEDLRGLLAGGPLARRWAAPGEAAAAVAAVLMGRDAGPEGGLGAPGGPGQGGAWAGGGAAIGGRECGLALQLLVQEHALLGMAAALWALGVL